MFGHLSPTTAIAAIFLLTASTSPQAVEDDAIVKFSGFGTLGAAHTQGHGAAFIRDLTQPHGVDNRGLHWEQDSRLGIQGNIKAGENLEGTVQIVSRFRNDNNFAPELTWGFLKYTVNDTLEVRGGRIGFDAYIGADTRDVGYSYLWARPPVEYYGTLFFPYEDGADVVVRAPIGNGVARVKLYTGITRQQSSSLMDQKEWAGNITLSSIGSTQDMNGSRVTGGFVDFQNSHWVARLGMARLDLKKDYPPGKFNIPGMLRANAGQAYLDHNNALGDALLAMVRDAQVIDKQATFKSLALAYEDGPLQAQLALSRITSNSLLIPNAHAGFITAGYRFGNITPYATLAAFHARRSDRGDELARLGARADLVDIANFILTSPLTNQHTYSIGARYDFAANLALKLQIDHVRNSDCSPVSLPTIGPRPSCAPPLMWTNVPVHWNGRANIFSAMLDFTF